MAIGNSGLFVTTWIDVLDTSQLAIDLDLDTYKFALFTNTVTPNYSTDTSYAVAPYNANEIPNGGGYTTGGVLLTGTAVSESPAGTIMWDMTDPQWASSTITNASGGLVYADPLTPKRAICLQAFGAPFSTVSGLFLVQLASGGMLNWDVTP